MRKKLLLLIFVPLILSLMVGSVYSGTQNVDPSDDCYVDQGAPAVNWDTCSLYVRDHEYLTFRSWLKFSVPGALTIEKAELYLYLNGLAFPDYTVIGVHGSSNTTWTEETITWNDQPDYGSVIDSETVYSTEIWYSWDVTANVTSGSTSTFCMIASTYYPVACFDDKEDTHSPYLKLTLAEGEGEEEEEPDITILNLPEQFGERLGISTWSAGMLLTGLLMFSFNTILILWKKGGIVALIFNFALLGIFTSFGWLPIWTTILIGVLVVAVSGISMKDRF